MVIDNLDIGRAVWRADKADAPLAIDTHGMLPSPITFQAFQMVAGWKAQTLHSTRSILRCEHRSRALY
jgi:hypothetical protein